jgi:hypothetical protein
MAKRLIPKRIIIEFVDGKFSNGTIMYKVSDSGVLSKIKSVGIKNAGFSQQALSAFIEKLGKHAEKSEGFESEMS